MEPSDAELVVAYRTGETNAFTILVTRHLGPVRFFILRLTRDAAVADDLAQEVLVKVWRALDRYDAERSFTTWLYTIARRTVIDWSRKRQPILFSALQHSDEDSIEQQLPDQELPLPDTLFARAERAELVAAALDALPPRYREVLVLHYLEGLSFAEISAVTGTPLHTVKSQSRRGGVRLKAILMTLLHDDT